MHVNDDKEVSKEALPVGWSEATIVDLIAEKGAFNDGDWVESKDQDPYGEVRLIQLADVGDGQYRNRSARFLTLARAEELHCTFLQLSDILVARMPDPLGRACIFPGDEKKSVTVVDVCIIRPGLNSVNSRWLMYTINSPQFRASIAELQSGTTRQRISRSNLAVLKLLIPPLPEQQRIVSAIEQQFTRLDSAVASLRSAQAKIKQYRASLLKSAVEGEMTKQWRADNPIEETGEQLLKRILVERRKRWEEKELAKMREKGSVPKDGKWKQAYKEPQEPDVENLPELPEGWYWATVEQIGDPTEQVVLTGPFGSTLGREDFIQDGVPLLTIGCLTEQGLSLKKAFYISEEKAFKLERYRVRQEDILFSRMASVGRADLVPKELEGSVINYHLMRLRLFTTAINPLYFIYFIRGSDAVIKYIGDVNHGMTRDGINTSQLLNMSVAVPPLDEQEQIVAEVEASFSNIVKLEEATENSLKRAEYERQSILREAFAGRLVPQDREDEPASVLLERIREERKKREESEKVNKVSRKGDRMEIAKRRRASKAVAGGQEAIGLYEKLVEAGQPLAPDDLFRRAGLKTDEQPESVELFYEELHADVEVALIGEIRPDDAHVLLEALEPSVESAGVAEADTVGHLQELKAESGKQKAVPLTLWDM